MTTLDEQLTTGWEQHAPVEDTLLRRYLFHNVALGQAFAVAGRRPCARRPRLRCRRPPRPERVLERGHAAAAPVGLDAGPGRGGAVLRHRIRRGAALGARGRRPTCGPRGWRLSGHPPLLARPPVDLATAARDRGRHRTGQHRGRARRVGAGRHRRLSTPRAAAGFAGEPRVALAARRRSAGLLHRSRRRRSCHGRRQCLGLVRLARHCLAGLRGHPAGGAGRGHWHGHAVARLRANPSVWTLGVFSDFSRPLAEHLGFVPLLRFTLWIRDRARGTDLHASTTKGPS